MGREGVSGLSKKRRGREGYHGIPTLSVFCMLMNIAKMPSVVAEAAIMIRSQKLSWISGQEYFRRRSTTRISVLAMTEGGGEGRGGRWGDLRSCERERAVSFGGGDKGEKFGCNSFSYSIASLRKIRDEREWS